jgi:hypothetical protein
VTEPPTPEPTGSTPGGQIDEPVPKLPRGRGIKLSGPELFRIGLTLIALIGVVVLTKPCANSVSGFVTSFDNGSNTPTIKPGTVDLPKEQHFEHLKPGMTEAEIKAAMERAKAANAGSAATAGSAGSAASNAGSAAISGSGTNAPTPAKP